MLQRRLLGRPALSILPFNPARRRPRPECLCETSFSLSPLMFNGPNNRSLFTTAAALASAYYAVALGKLLLEGRFWWRMTTRRHTHGWESTHAVGGAKGSRPTGVSHLAFESPAATASGEPRAATTYSTGASSTPASSK